MIGFIKIQNLTANYMELSIFHYHLTLKCEQKQTAHLNRRSQRRRRQRGWKRVAQRSRDFLLAFGLNGSSSVHFDNAAYGQRWESSESHRLMATEGTQNGVKSPLNRATTGDFRNPSVLFRLLQVRLTNGAGRNVKLTLLFLRTNQIFGK